MFAFAVMDGLTKILSQTMAIPEILWVRNIVFSALALTMLRLQNRGNRVGVLTLARSNRPWLQMTRALVLIVESGMFMLAFRLMPLADVHAMSAVAPLAVVALSVPFLGEHVGRRRWIAVYV